MPIKIFLKKEFELAAHAYKCNFDCVPRLVAEIVFFSSFSRLKTIVLQDVGAGGECEPCRRAQHDPADGSGQPGGRGARAQRVGATGAQWQVLR